MRRPLEPQVRGAHLANALNFSIASDGRKKDDGRFAPLGATFSGNCKSVRDVRAYARANARKDQILDETSDSQWGFFAGFIVVVLLPMLMGLLRHLYIKTDV